MTRKLFTLPAATAATLVIAAGLCTSNARASGSNYEPVLDPANFVTVIDNPYFPLPVGRTLVYEGVKDGQSLVDTVTVTAQTKIIEGITATMVSDISTHDGAPLERTFDYYAQDKQGNVWYLGEDTTEYLDNGRTDTSGSWMAGVHDAEPGLIMEADPQIPDAYRQEYLAGEAEDTAWVVERGGMITVPYGKLHKTLKTLEATRIEPGLYDLKVYAPGIGIVLEQSLTGPNETSQLVSITGP
ncbi:MAG TPA: hypothetical protein VNL37_00435 [Candidatus Polarisedimenticolia bacterium]|nr:hypothetical protein [Candidatus Polarisedimenticolia bacterium]